ncbi:putative ribonuclease H-like domain-containing protein [Tanacetum coccineum]
MVPRTVLTRSGPISLNIVRPVNTVQPRTTVNNAGPMKNVINNTYSTARRPFNKITAANNSIFTKKVNIVKGTKVNTARPKAVLSVVKENRKSCLRPHHDWHMNRNRSYLTDYEDVYGGFVAFGGNSKGGKITGKCKIRTARKDNMYSVDLKNVVPQGGLTCLFAKAILEESNLWHRRLGYVNFKTMNKLVRGNLVRGLPLKLFEINQTCVACQKGKQHRASSENKKRTLIEVAKTMLADAKLPTTFWAEAVNTACYVQNRVLVIKPHNKTPYELFLGYSTNCKAFRVFNSRTRIVEENLHVQFSENTSNKPVVAGNQSNGNAGTKACADTGEEEKKDAEDLRNESGNPTEGKDSGVPSTKELRINQEKDNYINSTNNINTASDGNSTNNVNVVSSIVNATGTEVNVVNPKTSIELPNAPNMPELEDIVYSDDDEDVGAKADINNLDAFMPVSPILTTRIHKDHPVDQIIRDLNSAPQTRRMTKNLKEHEEPKKVYKNKKDERGIMIKNKARLVAQWYTQEEGIDYDEFFALVARIKAIRLFLAYALFKDFVVYQMHVKSDFIYGKIKEKVYVCQPLGFEDPNFPDRVYKVEKALYDDIIFGSTKKKLCTEFKKMMLKKFQMSFMGELIFFLGLQVKQKEDGIFISQDKYVTKILKKIGFSNVKTVNTPMETHKPLLKDADGEDVDEHMYRSMIGSLMYLTSSRPNIMFAICVRTRFQVNLKVSYLYVVKGIFRYLKGQPKLGLWYLKDSPFDLVAYTDSDYAGASLDRKSTTGGCQFLGCRLISWQCKKQIVVANSTTEAEYVAASSCYSQVIVNGDAPDVVSASVEGPIPPKTIKQKLARKNELKSKSTLLLAIPDEHLLKFHGIKDAKTLWEEIKTRSGGNKESKKMQKTILKQQYENFTASRSEGLDKIMIGFRNSSVIGNSIVKLSFPRKMQILVAKKSTSA